MDESLRKAAGRTPKNSPQSILRIPREVAESHPLRPRCEDCAAEVLFLRNRHATDDIVGELQPSRYLKRRLTELAVDHLPANGAEVQVAPHDGHECILISDFPFGTESVTESVRDEIPAR